MAENAIVLLDDSLLFEAAGASDYELRAPLCQAQGLWSWGHVVVKGAYTIILIISMKKFFRRHPDLRSTIENQIKLVFIPLAISATVEIFNALLQSIPVKGQKLLYTEVISDAITSICNFLCLFSCLAFMLFLFKFKK